MDNDTQNVQPKSDLENIQSDLKNLYAHVSTAVGKKGEEARIAWEKTRKNLEEKRVILEERTKHLSQAGAAASADVKVGFSAALAELKKAYTEAKQKFQE